RGAALQLQLEAQGRPHGLGLPAGDEDSAPAHVAAILLHERRLIGVLEADADRSRDALAVALVLFGQARRSVGQYVRRRARSSTTDGARRRCGRRLSTTSRRKR